MSDTVNLRDLFDAYEKESAVTILQPGKHRLKVKSAAPRGTGVLPIFTPVDGPDAGKTVMAGGIYQGDTDGGRNAFFRKLEKFGLGRDFFQTASTMKEIADALVGRVITADLTVKEWNGEPRNELGFGITLEDSPALPAPAGVPAVATAAPAATPPAAPVVTQVAATDTASASAPPPSGDVDPGF